MVLMLAVMALVFVRLRDPNTWRWFARDNDDDNAVVADSEPAGGEESGRDTTGHSDAFRRKGSHFQRRKTGDTRDEREGHRLRQSAGWPSLPPRPAPRLRRPARPRPRKTRRLLTRN